MYTDIYKDHMYPVELFGKNALYTEGTKSEAKRS